MKKLKYILSAIVSIILLVSLMTFCNTTVMAATKIPSTSISSIKVKNEAIKIKWKKKSGITGYQIQYSTNSKFKKNNKKIKIKNSKTVSKKITGLNPTQKYYVRIRTYKGKKYSSWSKKKCIIVENSHCTNNNNHGMSCGNIGKWFNNKREIEQYLKEIDNNYAQKYENGEITYQEYVTKVPYGYECWSCGYCGKWTGNFYYRDSEKNA